MEQAKLKRLSAVLQPVSGLSKRIFRVVVGGVDHFRQSLSFIQNLLVLVAQVPAGQLLVGRKSDTTALLQDHEGQTLNVWPVK